MSNSCNRCDFSNACHHVVAAGARVRVRVRVQVPKVVRAVHDAPAKDGTASNHRCRGNDRGNNRARWWLRQLGRRILPRRRHTRRLKARARISAGPVRRPTATRPSILSTIDPGAVPKVLCPLRHHGTHRCNDDPAGASPEHRRASGAVGPNRGGGGATTTRRAKPATRETWGS